MWYVCMYDGFTSVKVCAYHWPNPQSYIHNTTKKTERERINWHSTVQNMYKKKKKRYTWVLYIFIDINICTFFIQPFHYRFSVHYSNETYLNKKVQATDLNWHCFVLTYWHFPLLVPGTVLMQGNFITRQRKKWCCLQNIFIL